MSPGFFFLIEGLCSIQVAVLVDGSNLISSLARADLAYPALGPLLAKLSGSDQIVFAHFYGAPPPTEPWKSKFQAMQRANRHIDGLEFSRVIMSPLTLRLEARTPRFPRHPLHQRTRRGWQGY
jgi:hypothetical protein